MIGDRAGASAAGVALSLMVHGVGHQALEGALPNWAACLPPANPNADGNSAEETRRRLQKKAWRAKCTMRQTTRNNLVAYAYIGEYPEHLTQKLQHAERRPGAMFDSVFYEEANPFQGCTSGLWNLLTDGAWGGLSLVGCL